MLMKAECGKGKPKRREVGIGFGMTTGHVGLQVKKATERADKKRKGRNKNKGGGSNRGCRSVVKWVRVLYCVYMVTSA